MKTWIMLKRIISLQNIFIAIITTINVLIFIQTFRSSIHTPPSPPPPVTDNPKVVTVHLSDDKLTNKSFQVPAVVTTVSNAKADSISKNEDNTLKILEYIQKNGAEPVDKLLHVNTKRVNMGKCNHIYGKVMVFVAVEEVAYRSQYKLALDSLRCYIASTDYQLKIIDVFKDERSNKMCADYKTVYFRKHCAARYYLEDTDWMLVMDADSGIVNPNHCIEEYIDDRVDMVFYERFFNWEIACGNYLVKNTNFSKDFLMRWADYEKLEIGGNWWKGFDNGAIHITALESIFPPDSQEVRSCRNIWYTPTGYETYIPYVMCVRFYLGGVRLWPRKFKLLRRAHSFCRDWYHTGNDWCEKDFLIHGWKAKHVLDQNWPSPFIHDFDLSKCGAHEDGWPWRPENRKSCRDLKLAIFNNEKAYAKDLPKQHIVIPFLNQTDVGDCYPDCDIRERIH